jgi:hypothetical protein
VAKDTRFPRPPVYLESAAISTGCPKFYPSGTLMHRMGLDLYI